MKYKEILTEFYDKKNLTRYGDMLIENPIDDMYKFLENNQYNLQTLNDFFEIFHKYNRKDMFEKVFDILFNKKKLKNRINILKICLPYIDDAELLTDLITLSQVNIYRKKIEILIIERIFEIFSIKDIPQEKKEEYILDLFTESITYYNCNDHIFEILCKKKLSKKSYHSLLMCCIRKYDLKKFFKLLKFSLNLKTFINNLTDFDKSEILEASLSRDDYKILKLLLKNGLSPTFNFNTITFEVKLNKKKNENK